VPQRESQTALRRPLSAHRMYGGEDVDEAREVLRQVRAYAEAGYQEVVLLGQTVNSYRHEDIGFARLLRTVATVEGIERIRFTSPYPVDFTSEVIDAIGELDKVCKYVHLPVQSGSDRMMERMRRVALKGRD